MNLYALNVTPINGWATWQGFGQAAMSLAGAGKSANVVLGAGSAQMALQSSGNGTRRAMGYSVPQLVLTSSGHGSIRSGVGGTATLILAWHYGQGGIFVHPRASVRLQLDIDANSIMGRSGVGAATAQMFVRGDARTYRLIHGAGTVSMALDFAYRVNAPIRVVPFELAPRDRAFHVPRECRRIIVPRGDDRTPGTANLPHYPDGTIAFDLIFDAARYGEASTASAIDQLEQIVTTDMPGNAWAGTP
ncbi:virion-associated phage protein [Burkholderia phage Bcep22]|uniref:Virion-associated phage protein n=1 Tax=Burkholderia phage Bcep22 TaxID=2883944 RepID=Q6V7N2_9CAUD|nr:virion structural protein [Burkholderia phage Bcep22]AAQ54994.1 virion-associated phage protein [Burkholderia phage Bcep22]